MIDTLKQVGTVPAVMSRDVSYSRIGIGFEKLDRNVFDPSKAYDRVGKLGVKKVRLQSGWARTETEKGVYHFEWLDDIVNNLTERGLEPWICLCYGNAIYDESAKTIFGAVGCPPIKTEEQKLAWRNYVMALVKRYSGKVQWYEVWNEPNGKWCWKHGVSGVEYGEFVKATASAIKDADPNAKVIGGSVCQIAMDWMTEMFSTGAGEVMDALTYHMYTPMEQVMRPHVKRLRALCKSYNPGIALIQGETGCQSDPRGCGALAHGNWSPLKQCKFMARHMMIDLFEDVLWASYFSCMDMMEALNGTVGNKASYMDFGYFGVLGATFDEDGVASDNYAPKPSFVTLQTIASLFKEDFTPADLAIRFCQENSARNLRQDEGENDITFSGFRRDNGSSAFAYWYPAELLTTSYESTVTMEVANIQGEPRLIDLIDGKIYEIPSEQIEDNGHGCRKFLHLPIFDYPLVLTFGDFLLK